MKTRRIAGWIALLLCALFLFAACDALGINKSTPEQTPDPSPIPTLATVVLDAGHGGIDGGAVGVKTGIVEAGLNLMLAELVKEKLEQCNIEVRMTRTDENALGSNKKADMKARKEIICAPDVDLVVSIHMNKFRDRSVEGPMAFYMKDSEEGRLLAEFMINSVCDAIGHARRLANPGDYYVIRVGTVPSVIIECGFLSNATDEKLLAQPDHQEKLASGIVAGVLEYLNQPKAENTPETENQPKAENNPETENKSKT